jgi:hypothetical protein
MFPIYQGPFDHLPLNLPEPSPNLVAGCWLLVAGEAFIRIGFQRPATNSNFNASNQEPTTSNKLGYWFDRLQLMSCAADFIQNGVADQMRPESLTFCRREFTHGV